MPSSPRPAPRGSDVRAALAFETLGNATIQVLAGDEPVLVTDPWLFGRAYFGSWGLELPPSPRQVENARRSRWVWFSHGHPDHYHPPSVDLLDPARQRVLVPDHDTRDLADDLVARGFEVEVLPTKRWVELDHGVRVMCLTHPYQDALLLIELGDALVVDRNDFPLAGEQAFVRRVVRRYRTSYLMGLCSVDADMINLVDASGRRTIHPPELLAPGAVLQTVDLCRRLGVGTYCASSSQHVYCREDSAWANAYRITADDLARLWRAEDVALVPPASRVEVDTGAVTPLEVGPEHVPAAPPDPEPVTDDWDARLSADEAREVEAFFAALPLLWRRLDRVSFTVGGVRHDLGSGRRRVRRAVHFHVPRGALLATVRSGYFDDLLIGNFARTELVGMDSLYPRFTPVVAKLAPIGVRTRADLLRFRWRWLRRSPRAFVVDGLHEWYRRGPQDVLRRWLRRLGLLEACKALSRRVRGLPPLRDAGRPDR